MDTGLYLYMGAVDRGVSQCGDVSYRQFMTSSVARRDTATLAEVRGGFCHSNPYKLEHASPFRP